MAIEDFDAQPIDPAAEWADVPQLSTQAALLGGPDGPLNAQAIALAKRTKWLDESKGSTEDVAAAVLAADTAETNAMQALETVASISNDIADAREAAEFVLALAEPDGTKRIGHGSQTVYQALGAISGFKNAITNGNFTVNQRAVSGTVTLAAGAYGHDRWKAGAAGCTYSFATVDGVTTLSITAGSLMQVIEGADLQSGSYRLSWQGTAQGRINSGPYALQAVGAASDIIGGTNAAVEFNTGTLSLPQFERGQFATAFDFRPIAIEQTLCKRYYYASPAIAFTQPGNSGTILQRHSYFFPVEMRANPSLVVTFIPGQGGGSAVDITRLGIMMAFTGTQMQINSFSFTASAEL